MYYNSLTLVITVYSCLSSLIPCPFGVTLVSSDLTVYIGKIWNSWNIWSSSTSTKWLYLVYDRTNSLVRRMLFITTWSRKILSHLTIPMHLCKRNMAPTAIACWQNVLSTNYLSGVYLWEVGKLVVWIYIFLSSLQCRHYYVSLLFKKKYIIIWKILQPFWGLLEKLVRSHIPERKNQNKESETLDCSELSEVKLGQGCNDRPTLYLWLYLHLARLYGYSESGLYLDVMRVRKIN